MASKFDDLIRAGEDTKAYKMLIKELYDGGKMGGTRKRLMERILERVEVAEKKLIKVQKAIGGAE